MTNNEYTSPVGDILNMYVSRMVSKKIPAFFEELTTTLTNIGLSSEDVLKKVEEAKEANKCYLVRLQFDNKEHQTFKEKITKINPKIVVDNKDGKTFTVKFATKRMPITTNNAGEILNIEEIPSFPKGSTGKAAVTFFAGKSSKGGYVCLTGVCLLSLDIVTGETTNTEEETLTSLKKIAQKYGA